MDDSEMRAKLVVLEVLVMTTIGIVFAITGPTDPDHSKALAIIDAARNSAKAKLFELQNPTAIKAGEHYLDMLLSDLSEGLRPLRPRQT